VPIGDILLSGLLEMQLLLHTKLKSILFDRVNFPSHCTLIRCDLVRVNQDTVSGYLHTLVDVNNITDQHEVLMNLHQYTVAPHRHLLLLVCHTVQFQKLTLLLVVVYGCYTGTDHHS
jgi:hypothetical protein